MRKKTIPSFRIGLGKGSEKFKEVLDTFKFKYHIRPYLKRQDITVFCIHDIFNLTPEQQQAFKILENIYNEDVIGGYDEAA